jgi:general secretion pathway protein A
LIVDEAQNLTPRAVEELRMLSNYQFGQQALLQTFLVGQPEFRDILQSPGMQQLRQRVTATCHIGPLDAQETQGYIEHRLHCAGASGRPTFKSAAFEAIHLASGGIPRRINQICDRLLLLGFLGEKDEFGLEEVNEVVGEMNDESAVSPKAPVNDRSTWTQGESPAHGGAELVDIDLGKLQINPALAGAISRQIDSLGVEQYDGRMRRLEGSVLRLERINLEILVMLQKLVTAGAAKKNAPESIQ